MYSIEDIKDATYKNFMINKAYVLSLERTTDEQCEQITLGYQSTQYWTQSSIPSVNDSITNSQINY